MEHVHMFEESLGLHVGREGPVRSQLKTLQMLETANAGDQRQRYFTNFTTQRGTAVHCVVLCSVS